MDKITAKIRNYRSKVRYATREEAESTMAKKVKQGQARGIDRKYRVCAWMGAFALGGMTDGIAYYTVEREG